MEIEKFLDESLLTVENLPRDKLREIIEVLQTAREHDRQVFLCGNGGSAGTATHTAADLFKIAQIRAVSLNENPPLTTAIINDRGWDKVYTDQLERLYNTGDILIAFSVHGGRGADEAGQWSQNLTKAIDYVNKNGGTTIGITGFDGGAFKDMCDICLIVPIESTPIVESIHLLVEHLITFQLQMGDRV